MTVVELFMALNALVGAIAGFRGGIDHAWYWALLATPVGLFAGVMGTFPVVVATGLMAFTLMPFDEMLKKDWPRLYEALEVVAGIVLIALAFLVPTAIFMLVRGGVDGLLTWMGW